MHLTPIDIFAIATLVVAPLLFLALLYRPGTRKFRLRCFKFFEIEGEVDPSGERQVE